MSFARMPYRTGVSAVRNLCMLIIFSCRFNHDPRWSETGDRYIIKLFRDYLFHQVGQDGRPVLHMTHVLSCLNKVRRGGGACGVFPKRLTVVRPAGRGQRGADHARFEGRAELPCGQL